ncbi:hypothetical protein R3P38DRAFT_3592108 [Favolaschia claudopus]|uniref:RRM domain-containing protein n=1 Tax=Favolaschia claudopus TaxID=2862362 RepID=A0AAW0AHD2_9AGAR
MSVSSPFTKRLHISFTPSVPANGPEDLKKALTAHFGKFATVKSVDGLGKLDAVGGPRKFAYISLEGSEAGINRCRTSEFSGVSSLSGSIWKGVKVRVGDAKPDFSQRIATENTADAPPPKRKRKRGAVQADDMTLVSPDTAANRAGWKVTEMGRIVRPLRMRPAHPLPPPLVSAVKKTDTGKPKKRRDPDSRARRRTIDPTIWGSVHLKGVFLENAGQVLVHDDIVGSDESSEDEDEDEEEAPEVVPPPARLSMVTQKPPPAPTPSPAPPPPPSLAPLKPTSSTPASPDVDLATEKTHSLALLQSFFGSRSDADWVGRESVGSDVDEAELLKVGGGQGYVGGQEEDGVEYVPMEVDGDAVLPFAGAAEVEEGDEEEEKPPAPQQKAPTQATKLKDLFAAKAPDASFSLLGHLDLDLDLELDDELIIPSSTTPAPVPHHQAPAPEPLAPQAYLPITLDPKEALFFPTSSFAFSRNDHGFYKTQTDAEIRAQWEGEKVALTQGWKRRWREAGKRVSGVNAVAVMVSITASHQSWHHWIFSVFLRLEVISPGKERDQWTCRPDFGTYRVGFSQNTIGAGGVHDGDADSDDEMTVTSNVERRSPIAIRFRVLSIATLVECDLDGSGIPIVPSILPSSRRPKPILRHLIAHSLLTLRRRRCQNHPPLPHLLPFPCSTLLAHLRQMHLPHPTAGRKRTSSECLKSAQVECVGTLS